MSELGEKKRVMMEIEIKFGKGRSDRVMVHYNDDPEVLAMVSQIDNIIFYLLGFAYHSLWYLYRTLCSVTNLRKVQRLSSPST